MVVAVYLDNEPLTSGRLLKCQRCHLSQMGMALLAIVT